MGLNEAVLCGGGFGDLCCTQMGDMGHNSGGERLGVGRAGGALSIESFLTDGSIARLCDELGRLRGVPIWVVNADGRVVAPGHDGKLWALLEATDGARRAAGVVGVPFDERAELFRAPIKTTAGRLGDIVTLADWGRDEPIGRRALERAIMLLASTAAESCEDQLTLRRRVHELDALFRLSSVLVGAGDPDRVLEAALNLALDVMGLDAGSIAVLDPDGDGVLRHRVARGLSEAYLGDTTPLSADGALRERALGGAVVTVDDLLTDARIADHERPRGEGLRSLITTGLIFQGRPAGLMRLYSRSPRLFSEEETGLLRSIADQSAMALAHQRLRRLRDEDQQIKRQVQLAADVQRRMLPQTLPDMEPFELASRYAPSFQLGGDFYDLFPRRGQLFMAVCDVVGKGVPAALLMSAVRASLRAYTQDLADLDEVMGWLNRALARDTLESEFATLWVGVADPKTLRMTFCGAGHDPPLIFRVPGHRAPSMADVDELAAGGMALGIDPSQRYQLGQFDLRPGDVVLTYTDGLTDATDYENRKFGRDRVKAAVLGLLADQRDATAGEIAEHLVRELRQFCGLRAANDDVTLVVLRVRTPREIDASVGGSI